MSTDDRPPVSPVHPLIPFAFGLAGQAAQVALAREFLAVFYGNELSIAILFGLWLFWTAAGSAIGSQWGRDPAAALQAASALLFPILPGAIWAIRCLPPIFGIPAGHYLPLAGLALSAGAILAPLGLVIGASFAWAVRGSPRPGRIYALEAAGAAIGAASAAAGAHALGSFALSASAGAVLWAAWLAAGRRWAGATGMAASAALAVFSGKLDRAAWERYWRHLGPGFRLVETFDSHDGPCAALERGGDVSIYRGGRLWTTLPDGGDGVPIACAVLLQHPAPRRIFSAGASSWFPREALLHGAELVEAVEPDRRIFDLIRRYDPAALADRRIVTAAGDARRSLRREALYDVILVSAGEPDTALANRFYTAEFFELARRRLAAGGVLAVGPLAAPSGYSADELLRRNWIVFRTAAAVFPGVRATPGASAWLVASTGGPVLLDWEGLAARAAARGRAGADLSALSDPFQVEKAAHEFLTGRAYDPLSGRGAGPAEVPPTARRRASASGCAAWTKA